MAENQNENRTLLSGLGDRIAEILAENKENPNSVATQLGVTRITIQRAIDEETVPNAAIIAGLIRLFPNISSEWLLTGSGGKYKNVPSNEQNSPHQDKTIQDSIFELVSVLKQQAEAILKNSSSIENQTITIKQNAFTIEAQRSQIADLNNKGIRRDIDVLQQSVNVLLKEKIEEQKRKDDQKGRKKAG